MLQGVGPADVVAGLPDHDRQFALVVDLVTPQLPRQHDRIAGVLQGARVLEEEHGVGRRGGVALGGMSLVVEADAEDVAGLERREQLVDLGDGVCVAERAEKGALEQRHAAISMKTSQVGGTGGLKADDLHGVLRAEKVWRSASIKSGKTGLSTE